MTKIYKSKKIFVFNVNHVIYSLKTLLLNNTEPPAKIIPHTMHLRDNIHLNFLGSSWICSRSLKN